MREVTAEASMRWTFAQFGQLNPSSELVRGAIDAFFAYEDTCWCAIPDAQAVLRTLAKRELRMGMLSNASHDPLIQRLVDRLGFRPWLDPALSSADTGIRKPDPAAFGPILQAWKLPGRALMMVGDTLGEDILGARRAGMHAVWIPSRKDARQESAVQASDPLPETPDATIDRLGDLPDYLDRL
jgi:putative hydrolase of the HAD superfamily